MNYTQKILRKIKTIKNQAYESLQNYVSIVIPRGGSRISSWGGGAHLKKLRRAVGGANIFGVFRVKNHDFTQFFFIFFPILGRARHSPPLDPPLCLINVV
jgi:hypothetical protein